MNAQLLEILFFAMIAGLILFLYEVRLATRALKVSRRRRMERLAE